MEGIEEVRYKGMHGMMEDIVRGRVSRDAGYAASYYKR